ncbi:arginine--tRNA ligase [Candidatus Parabeggiatoa sp. HSG14]|uniref:arginine--tRNA ligase n=1 Tax=Candidatus Parabeggiatoa sp. HSG14 TaxID=3055593 RepID=UPI0025A76768|nr:arginine--tRNA ligase [Thiotrichales bacterium HSG14]
MKKYLHTLFTHAIATLQTKGDIPQDIAVNIHLERTRDTQHGDFACNVAMVLAKSAHKRPHDLATSIVEQLPNEDDFIAKIEIAGPGFINIFLKPNTFYAVINEILTAKDTYGQSQIGAEQSVMIEFVSANPTGPLHVGHGRGAALGAVLANLLIVAGYKVYKEYYVNDAGRQMDILATSVWLRYLELCGEILTFPVNGYKGDYVWDIAASLHREQDDALQHSATTVFENIPPDADEQGGNEDIHIDALIERCQQLLGEKSFQHLFQKGLETIREDIRHDLEQFGVVYDEWFSESSLSTNHRVNKVVEQLKAGGHTYKQNGALWFCSSVFGDEKDRVLIRENGQFTYFASDIAYHVNKLERGFDHLIDIWGADHHGYITRVKAAITALGAEENRLTVLSVQFATLYRGQEKLQMSTRSGEFVTLRELREEVGRDAARFFYLQHKSEQHLNFDLELAKSRSIDNPVYYIQYAHARINSVFRQLHDKNQTWHHDKTILTQLNTDHEQTLLITLSRYPEIIEMAAQAYEVHQLTYYLRKLAQDFHTFYDVHKILVEDNGLRNARLSLIAAVQQVLRNGLTIIGVSTPEVM